MVPYACDVPGCLAQLLLRPIQQLLELQCRDVSEAVVMERQGAVSKLRLGVQELCARLGVAAVEVRVDSGVEGAPQALNTLLRGVSILNCDECDILLLARLDRYA
eukprot:6212772-Pleurochrysis_carterae.AAC.1